ncbi:NAD(P)/FAD-dependent oxidoreductase [Palleronia sp. LCG004]|uniref:NAD(P)/FAD-dependent oxidoreductase n=1 Tax=Palleronia sp. LCG004 TaxID=3079304 RepID=UPI002942478D|nr:NAD(P)/FAD-dependent oxidoreductase [Palleronia sp. LCG004]WOI56627.1 NAD(P)/FAD-dependent oxidoreductase [Palleronia sp. LCG004]
MPNSSQSTLSPDAPIVVIGGGPAGLTAAYELQKRGAERPVHVFEAGRIVGGISRTESHNGYRFDIGGHRFFTKVSEVEDMWTEVLGDDFITVPRTSRIYYKGRYFDYPLKIFNALGNLGPYEASRIAMSYVKWKMRPHRREETFEEWVINRFGGRLYMHFFRTYTEKVWGIPPDQIQADWAAQRIKNLSLPKAVINAVTGANDTASLIEKFRYPRLGPGMMWERVSEIVTERGGRVDMQTEVTAIHRDGMRVTGVDVRPWTEEGGPGETRRIDGSDFVNSMAVDDLIAAFDPPPPAEVREAAARLRYRDFLIVTLCLDHADPFPDNWIYVHSSDVKVGRIQNFRAWSKEMLADPETASIGMEYFCHEGDGLWSMEDDALRDLAAHELEKLGLAPAQSVIDYKVIRQRKAYPVYDGQYRAALDTITEWLKQLENFQTVGRNGQHRYNNQDHSMLSAMLAARNILGEDHDVWNVNVERSYHEDFQVSKEPGDAPLAPEKPGFAGTADRR